MANESKERRLSRRELLRLPAQPETAKAVSGLVGATLVRRAIPGSGPRAPRDAFGRKVIAGKVGDFAVGDVIYFNTGRFYLSRVPEGFLALYRRCPHEGCIVPWRQEEEGLEPRFTPQWQGAPAQGRFICLCHGSIFDRYGVVHGGPARRPLDLMKIDILPDGTILVDTADIQERSAFDLAQVTAVPGGTEKGS